MATSPSKSTKCPACGGTETAIIRFQGESYYQCVTLRPSKVHGREHEKTICKFWSTKWRPANGN